MRVLLFVVVATSVLGWGHPLERISPAQGRQVNRFLKGKYERQWKRQGGNYGEIVGGGAGNAVGQLASAALGTLTGGNIGTRAGRSGLGAAARISGEYLGGNYGGKAGAFLGRQVDKRTKTGRQAQATAANAKKAEAEALKKPVLYSGGDYQKAKLSRTGTSPALLQRNKGAPGGASTSGNKPQVNNKGKAPVNAGGSSGASTSGTKGSPSKALASTKHGASTSGTKSAPSSPSRPTSGQGDKKPGAFSRAKESVKTTLRNAVTPSANKMLRLNAIAPRPPPAGKSGGGQAVVKSKKK
ncbi:unnamed protein product [Aphanomyces euteiches]|uniref:Glycine zipper 2TM domain-containing protein n=1 Tax=Aphanomyces euteiches TaxID=100861 RepID=A0A6G0WCP5_9STRA|nr:hypothetical protein Ae201684_017127 [Aphanomyces euteiches]KAH9074098.1 hypothetical protein Ae201684P_015996 [Aphanomyces euteiches]